jgi:hypothetical protein
MAYPDNFQRADGSLGADWTVLDGGVLISGGNAVASAPSHVLAANGSESGAQDHYIVLPVTPGSLKNARVMLKRNPAGPECYFMQVADANPNLSISLGYWWYGRDLYDVNAFVAWPTGDTFTMRFAWVAGVWHGYINDVLVITNSGSDYAAYGGFGFSLYESGAQINAFDEADTPAKSIDVTPDPLWIGGGRKLIDVTGTNTAWTPGVPGSSTVSVDHGVLDTQVTYSATLIRVYYTPDLYIGPITFTESEYGCQDTITPTIEAQSGDIPLGQLSATAIAYIERSAVAEASPTIANRDMNIQPSGSPVSMLAGLGDTLNATTDANYTMGDQPAVSKLVSILWQMVNGLYPPPDAIIPPPSNTTLKMDLADLLARFQVGETSGEWTIDDVLNILGGLTHKSHVDILDAIEGISAPDLSSVLDAIAAVRGDDNPDLTTITTALVHLATGEDYTLASVKGWIDGLPQSGGTPTILLVLAAVALIALAIPTGGADLAAAAVAVEAGPILDAVNLFEIASLIGEIATVAADIATIKSALSNPRSTVPPVWPGEGHVTYGDSHALSNGLTITEAMHGVLVHITEHPPGAGVYGFGDMRSWGHAGACAFKSDHGEFEWPISLGPEDQIITPRSMGVAAGCVLRVGGGYGGTVVPWTITGG